MLVECSATAYVTPGTALRLRRDDEAVARDARRPAAGAARAPAAAPRRHAAARRAERRRATARARPRRRAAWRRPRSPARCREVLAAGAHGRTRSGSTTAASAASSRRQPRAGWTSRSPHAREGGEKLARRQGHQPARHRPRPAGADGQGPRRPGVSWRSTPTWSGLSFAQRPRRRARAARAPRASSDAAHLGIVLKIETRRGFEHLPELLLAAMAGPAAGVMIARGDLAVECGFERLAEVQEEILWLCEAAHVPVVWATQVLETLAKTGLPVARRDHRRGDGRARRVRDAQQGAAHPRRHAHARRHPAAHAGPPVQEAAAAAGAEVLESRARLRCRPRCSKPSACRWASIA